MIKFLCALLLAAIIPAQVTMSVNPSKTSVYWDRGNALVYVRSVSCPDSGTYITGTYDSILDFESYQGFTAHWGDPGTAFEQNAFVAMAISFPAPVASPPDPFPHYWFLEPTTASCWIFTANTRGMHAGWWTRSYLAPQSATKDMIFMTPNVNLVSLPPGFGFTIQGVQLYNGVITPTCAVTVMIYPG